ncbi:MAG: hypothetical protein B6226_05690, partial [Candidatus Cloacimonetes bacterium 4572_65]
GVACIRATSGQKALDISKDVELAIIVIDVSMPEMDGFETVQHLKRRTKNKFTPVIFVSAVYNEEYYFIKGIESGGIDFILKPIVPKILLGKMRLFLDMYEQRLAIKSKVIEAEIEKDEIARSEHEFRNMFDHSPVSLWETDVHESYLFLQEIIDSGVDNLREYLKFNKDILKILFGKAKILAINNATKKLLKVESLDQMKGQMEVFVNEEYYLTLVDEIIAMARGDVTFEGESSLNDIYGNRLTVVVSWVSLPNKGKKYSNVLFSFLDITESTKTLKALKRATKKTELATIAKSEFLASVSHEIRTPMNGIIGMVNLLGATDLSEEQKEYLRLVKIGGSELLGIITNILDYSRIESGAVSFDKSLFNLKDCIKEVFDMSLDLIGDKKLELIYLIDLNIPEFIKTDLIILRKILLNLVHNAIKFSNDGEVFIHIQQATEEKGFISLNIGVHDTGIGIEKEDIVSLFKPFSQIEKGGTKHYNGAGLGLAITKKLVDALGGDITVTSHKNRGTTFTVKLEVEVETEVGNGAKLNKNHLAGKQVLIVNCKGNCKYMLKEQFGIKSIGVNSLEEAVVALNSGIKFDFALIDIVQNGMDGYLLASELKKLFPDKHLPLIMVNAEKEGVSISKTNSGIEAYIIKPLNIDVFRKMAYKVCGLTNLDTQVIHQLDRSLAKEFPLRILLAEDNYINQQLALHAFLIMGYSVDLANNGFDVMMALNKRTYDVIFMETQMPEMNGFETFEKILLRHGDNRPKVVAMTTGIDDNIRLKCIEVGMDDYIMKPLQLIKIQNVIKRVTLNTNR